MDKRERDLKRLIESLGCTLIKLVHRKGHYRVTLQSPSGAEFRTTFSGSPSDHRVYKKRKSQINRLIELHS